MREKLLEFCNKWKMELKEQVPLSEHTTFRIGGNADYWIEIEHPQLLLKMLVLSDLLHVCKKNAIPYFVMGKGSNILATDDGFRGLVIHMGNGFSDIHEGDEIPFEVGLSLMKASKYAEEHGLTGMEGLSGIPGTVGGALYMNAGAYGYEMSQIVTGCTYLDENGDLKKMDADELQLSYRHSYFMEHPGNVIVSVSVSLDDDKKPDVSARMRDFLARRNEKQPLNYPSAGSTFKRPEVGYASQLIDECGLKGYTVGGAQVSEKHAGFVINRNHATFADVMQLCEDVRRIVKEQKGISLELEPIILGTYQKE